MPYPRMVNFCRQFHRLPLAGLVWQAYGTTLAPCLGPRSETKPRVLRARADRGHSLACKPYCYRCPHYLKVVHEDRHASGWPRSSRTATACGFVSERGPSYGASVVSLACQTSRRVDTGDIVGRSKAISTGGFCPGHHHRLRTCLS